MIVHANPEHSELEQLQKLLMSSLGKNRKIMVDVKSNIIRSSSKKKGEELGVLSMGYQGSTRIKSMDQNPENGY